MRLLSIAFLLMFTDLAHAETVLLDCALEGDRFPLAISINENEIKHLNPKPFFEEELKFKYRGKTLSSYLDDVGFLRITKQTETGVWALEAFSFEKGKDTNGTCYDAGWAVSQFSDVIGNLEQDLDQLDIISDNDFASCQNPNLAGIKVGGPFTLTNTFGETVTNTEVFDKPSLVYFGYTSCPDVCPIDTARNVAAVELLESQDKLVTPVFISIDPNRDTPDVMSEYIKYFHDRMVGLTGSTDQVASAAREFKVYYRKQSGDDSDLYYLIDHSSFSYLVLPRQGVVEYFRRDASAEDVADGISCFLQ